MNTLRFPSLISLVCILATFASANPVLKIDTAKATAHVSPTLYGLMTEEINYSYDGGLYAELIRNRIFKDDARNPAHWSIVQDNDSAASISLDESQPLENTALTTCLKLNAGGASVGHRVGIANDGYWGIPVRPNTTYRASFYAKADGPSRGPLMVSIESNDGGKVFATARVEKITGEWQKYTVALRTKKNVPTSASNRFVVSTEKPERFGSTSSRFSRQRSIVVRTATGSN